MIIIVMIPFINIIPLTYCYFDYYEDDTIYEDIKANIDYYSTEDSDGYYRSYYGDNLSSVLDTALTVDYEPITRIDAVKILVSANIDKISRAVRMPFAFKADTGPRLAFLFYFELNGTNYLLCDYMSQGYKLYMHENNETLNTLLDKECFVSDRFFTEMAEIFLITAAYSIIKNYIPILILTAICFVPFLLKHKKALSQKAKKTIFLLPKIGFAAIPISIALYILRIYSDVDVSLLWPFLEELRNMIF